MYYEINVSQNGVHHFATAERSIRDEEHAKALFFQLRQAFPESEGYQIQVTEWVKTGTRVFDTGDERFSKFNQIGG